MKRPIVFALAFLILGIIVGRAGLPFAPFFVAAVLACAGLYHMYKYAPVVVFALFFLVGAWRVDGSLYSHTTEPFFGEFSGVVLDTGYTAGGNQRAVIRSEHPKTGAHVRIMAYIQPHQPHVALGQDVRVAGEFLPLAGAVNPGGYDQFQHLRSQKIDATIWPEEIIAGEVRGSFSVFLRRARDSFAAVYDEILPAREAAVIKSMVLGDRLDMDRDLAELYRTMGIFHILSISGLHVTILMLAANKLLSLALNERRAGAVVLVVMVLYCLMTGAAVATVRAVTMGGVLVGAKIFYRDYDLIASVSVACVALLIFEPLYLFNVGFQLSFGAVFGIGVLTAPVERLIRQCGKGVSLRLPSSGVKSLAVGISAVVSTYIIFAFHFYEIPLYSVLGNLVIAPTVTLILVVGILVGIVGVVAMPVAVVLSGTVYFILRFYEAAAVFFSDLPFAMVNTGGGNVFVAAAGALVLCAFAFTYHGFEEDFRRRAGLLAASVFALVVAVFLMHNPPAPQMTALYTRGEYTVLRHRGDTLIIGAAHGGEGDLLRYLDKRGTRRAALLLTHPPRPQDTARLERLLPRLHTVYLPAHAEGVTASLMYSALADLDLEGVRVVYLHDGDRRVAGGNSVRVRALEMGRWEVLVE